MMKKTLMTIVALGIGATSLATMSSQASAGSKHGWYGWYGNYNWHHVYNGYGYHHGYYYGGGNCYFYLKKARHTGKRYWWKKYKYCVAAYDHEDY